MVLPRIRDQYIIKNIHLNAMFQVIVSLTWLVLGPSLRFSGMLVVVAVIVSFLLAFTVLVVVAVYASKLPKVAQRSLGYDLHVHQAI